MLVIPPLTSHPVYHTHNYIVNRFSPPVYRSLALVQPIYRFNIWQWNRGHQHESSGYHRLGLPLICPKTLYRHSNHQAWATMTKHRQVYSSTLQCELHTCKENWNFAIKTSNISLDVVLAVAGVSLATTRALPHFYFNVLTGQQTAAMAMETSSLVIQWNPA